MDDNLPVDQQHIDDDELTDEEFENILSKCE